jgi:DNA-binding transcriptional ArsR family regulator
MIEGPYIAEAAALIGDPARASMLASMMDGRAYTASELAHVAGVAAPTASGHLAKLLQSGLLSMERQGRHRYYRLAGPRVAAALESLMALAVSAAPRHRPTGPRDSAMRRARTCYDHLAGELGVALTWRLVELGYLQPEEGRFRLTAEGETALARLGVDVAALGRQRRPLARACLDWSERRPHLAGALGAAMLDSMVARGWIERTAGSRTVRLTPAGRRGLAQSFGLALA